MKSIRFWAYFSAFFSLVLSFAMIGYWICDVRDLKVVNLNTFVGVTVALLGMIVTLAIAWQIYNAVEMRSKIEELRQLEDKFKEQEKSLEQFSHKTVNNINKLVAWEFLKDKIYLKAFYYYLSALDASVQMDDSDDINVLLETMAKICEESIELTDAKILEDIKKTNNHFKSVPSYRFIKDRYEPIYNRFISKVEKNEEKQ